MPDLTKDDYDRAWDRRLAADRAEPVPSPNPPPVEVRLPGSAWTYRSRELLKAIGLRWDPATHAWHGRIAASDRAALALDGASRVPRAAPLESFAEGESQDEPAAGKPPRPPEPPRGPHPTTPTFVGALPRVRDHSRSRLEARTFYRVDGEVADGPVDLDAEDPSTTRRFTAWETTSGLPDDSRESDERVAERRLRDLRGRVTAARAVVATQRGLAQTLQTDSQRAPRFYARFGISRAEFCGSVPAPATADEFEPLSGDG